MEGDYAAILLDINMPGMDGFETAALIHQHPRFEKTPIIFVTAVHVTDLDRLKGYELGAVDYVYVPVVPEILRGKVQVLIELYRQRREARAAEPLARARTSRRTPTRACRRRKRASWRRSTRRSRRRTPSSPRRTPRCRERHRARRPSAALNAVPSQPIMGHRSHDRAANRDASPTAADSRSERSSQRRRFARARCDIRAELPMHVRAGAVRRQSIRAHREGYHALHANSARCIRAPSRARRSRTLREADRRKDEFLAMLSHELRNPLAAIQGAIELMQRNAIDGPAARSGRATWSRGRSGTSSRLIDDLLDVSRITRGKLTLQQEPVELARSRRSARSRPCGRSSTRAGTSSTVALPDVPARTSKATRSGSRRWSATCSRTPRSTPTRAGASSSRSSATGDADDAPARRSSA